MDEFVVQSIQISIILYENMSHRDKKINIELPSIINLQNNLKFDLDEKYYLFYFITW